MDIVERLLSYRPPYGWPEEYSIIVEPTLNHVAADEIERLREALQSISNNTCCDNCQEAALVARAALKEKE